MGVSVTKEGPYFNGGATPSNTTNIKFSQMRDASAAGPAPCRPEFNYMNLFFVCFVNIYWGTFDPVFNL